MSLLSAAAADEDGDIIQALRAENDALKTKLMAATKSALDHVQRNRDLEALLEAVGAGGVGPLIPTTVQHQRNPSRDNDLQRENGHLSTTSSSIIPNRQLLMSMPVPMGPPPEHRKADQVAYPLGKLMDDEIARVKAEQPPGEQEPVAVISDVWTLRWAGRDPIATIVKKHGLKIGDKLYTRPQPRQPLTNEQILGALCSITNEKPKRLPLGWVGFARAIERAHGIGAEE